MYPVTLTDLYTKRFFINTHVVTKEQWSDRRSWSFKKRNGSALLYVNACEIVYTSGKKTLLVAEPGDLLYIPSGAMYTCTFQNCNPNAPYRGLKIDFAMFDHTGEKFVFADEIIKLNEFFNAGTLPRLEEIHRLFTMPETPITCINAKLELFVHELSLLSKQKDKRSPRFAGITKGIEYMERDPDQSLSIAAVAALCPASISYFNRAFKEYSGMTPIEYRYARKIEQAKTLLQSDQETVKSVSYALKFETPSYFCRMFKKKTGFTPKEYRDKCLQNKKK